MRGKGEPRIQGLLVGALCAAALSAHAQDRWSRVGMSPGPGGADETPPVVSAASLPESELQEIFEKNKGRFLLVEGALVTRTAYPQDPGFTARPLNLRVTQVVDENTVFLSDDKGTTYAMNTPDAKTMFADQRLGERWYRPDGVYRDTTVVNAPQQIRKIVPATLGEPTFEAFRASLRGGGRVLVNAVVNTACPACKGSGFMPRERGKLGRQSCPECKTTKTVRAEKEAWLTR